MREVLLVAAARIHKRTRVGLEPAVENMSPPVLPAGGKVTIASMCKWSGASSNMRWMWTFRKLLLDLVRHKSECRTLWVASAPALLRSCCMPCAPRLPDPHSTVPRHDALLSPSWKLSSKDSPPACSVRDPPSMAVTRSSMRLMHSPIFAARLRMASNVNALVVRGLSPSSTPRTR